MRVDALTAEQRRPVLDHLARLRHDLGKYVTLQVRWLGDGAAPDALRDALAADLLATRRGPDATVGAVDVWAEFRPGLLGLAPLPDGPSVDLSDDPDVARLDAAMTELGEVAGALRDGGLDAAGVERGAAVAAEVSELCRALWLRARGG